MSSEGLVVADVEVAFDATMALDGADLSVAPGEIMALLGPSGCGKTTLLRFVAGLQTADRGTVSWQGRDLTGLAPQERRVGLMFQDHALFPHRDVGANVAFGLRMQRAESAEIRARVGEMLELVGLAGFEHRAVDTLSGGEAQRVALARALAPRPEVVLLDEPLGSLDRTLRDRLALELRRILKELAITAVHVTHDHGEAFTVADRLAVMGEGQVLAVGEPAEMRRSPRTAAIARFLGLENIIDGPSMLRERFGFSGCAVVLPEAIDLRVGPGPLAAVVDSSTFRGDRYELRCRLDDGTVLVTTSAGRRETGERIALDIDPAGVIELAE